MAVIIAVVFIISARSSQFVVLAVCCSPLFPPFTAPLRVCSLANTSIRSTAPPCTYLNLSTTTNPLQFGFSIFEVVIVVSFCFCCLLLLPSVVGFIHKKQPLPSIAVLLPQFVHSFAPSFVSTVRIQLSRSPAFHLLHCYCHPTMPSHAHKYGIANICILHILLQRRVGES